jgi:hypothetical protein
MVLYIAVVGSYGYDIALSLWAIRVQKTAAGVRHDPYDHPAIRHVVERFAHMYIASVLIVSLAVRLVQLTFDITACLLVPLTILAALPTARVLTVVWGMGIEDLHNWYIGLLNRSKTTVLLVCAAGLFIDQVWRVVTLFWF